MPKKILEDIKPISRGAAKTRRESPARVARTLPHEVPFEPIDQPRSSRYGMWYVAVFFVIVCLFSLSFLFEKATITITPKSMPVAFDSSDTFTAEKDSSLDNTIIYTEMTLSGDQSIRLPSTVSKTETMPAKGRVVLYNAYTNAPYKLVQNTRLGTPDGKIYRINTGVVIPGYTKAGGTVIPGSVEVDVTAANPGEDENIDNSDFVLPGLAGTVQATKIYGRTKTAITGGVSGTIYSIPADAANAALGTLKDKLETTLIAKAKAQLPDGYVLFDGATSFTPDDSVQAPYSKDQQVPLALHGTLTAYLIKESSLVQAIAEKSISQYNEEPITIPDLSSLTMKPVGSIIAGSDASFDFSLLGTAKIVWTVSSTDVANLFAGHKKSDLEILLSNVLSIDKAEVVLKPFWKQSFPNDPNRITVTQVKP